MPIKSTDYALLAKDSYKDHELNEEIVLGGVKYRTFDYVDNPRTGFQATAYQRVETDEIVIAFRGTEFDREALRDGAIDAGMALAGVNAQAADANAFTTKVLAQAKADAKESKTTVNVSVTGHSLGGTLAQLEAHKFGLKGETFNAYGAAGLLHGVPKGGDQVINHVRAGDAVSAASAHFGEVRVYAVQQDIDTLRSSGYRDNGGALSMRNPVKAADFRAHFVKDFAPDNQTLGGSIISQENQARYHANQSMIDRYRSDVYSLRTGLSIPLQTGVQAGMQTSQAVDRSVRAVGNAAEQVYDAARDKVETGARRAADVLERTSEAVREGSSRIIDKVTTPSSWFGASQTGPVPPLNQPQHPGNALYEQSLAGLEKINAERGILSDQRTCNAAGTLAAAACQSGFKQIDHVALGDNSNKLVAVQGQPGMAHSKVIAVPTVQAMNTPLEDSSIGYLQAMSQTTQAQLALASQSQQQVRPQPAMAV